MGVKGMVALMQEYEALVKIEDNVNDSLSQEEQGSLWKVGDIVAIKPKGWVWGRMEVKHFLIVNVGNLNQSEIDALLEEVTLGGRCIARRRRKVDVTTLLGELPIALRDDVFNRDKEAQPFRQSAINSKYLIPKVPVQAIGD
jgi:hypothetical protein